ncbi:MAG: hypothetical protein V4819_12290 [Verrucomicrobiota bacterium]
MNRFPATAVLAASLALASAADEEKSSVRFSNNDRLSGSMASITTERLVWNSPILEKPTPFFLKNVLDLTLPAAQPEIKARHEASVTLTRGDLLRGQLASVTDDVVELDTWYAGRLKIHRPMVADIRITERPDFNYRGPTGLDGWKQSGLKPAWTYQNSSFRSGGAGSIARNVDLPDECSIAFDAVWRGSFWLKLAFFSDDLATDSPASGYEMLFQQRAIQLRSCKTKRFIGQTSNATALQENEKARIEVRASAKTGTICVYIDGHIIEKWTDPDFVRNEIGRGIHFISNTSAVQISRIEIGAWDGEVEQVPDPQAVAGMPPMGVPGGLDSDDEDEAPPVPAEKPKSGRMELRNGDSIAGEVVSITDGMITVKTPFRDVKLPIETLRSVALKPVDRDESKRENGDVRGWFPDGSSVVFRFQGVGDGFLTGYSQNFGTAQFKIAAFSRIEFNIYDPDLEDIRMANGW